MTEDDFESKAIRNKKILDVILYDVFDLVLTWLDKGRKTKHLPCMPGLKTFFNITSQDGKHQ